MLEVKGTLKEKLDKTLAGLEVDKTGRCVLVDCISPNGSRFYAIEMDLNEILTCLIQGWTIIPHKQEEKNIEVTPSQCEKLYEESHNLFIAAQQRLNELARSNNDSWGEIIAEEFKVGKAIGIYHALRQIGYNKEFTV